jgi:NADH:ubiquinone oxidoreductase subunit 6 (subunit J)
MALFDFLSDNWPLFIAPLLGLFAVYTMLPGPKQRPALLGVGAGLAALVLGGFIVARAGAITGVELGIEVFLFYILSLTAIVGGVSLITQHNPARAALSFAVVVLSSCGLFLLQASSFLTVATIIVYAGAIIVTFLFVLMLAQQEGQSSADDRSREPFLSSLTGFLLLCALLYVLKVTYKPDLDRWVEKSRLKLDLIKTLRESKKEPTLAEKKTFILDLAQFRTAYDRWLRNDWLAEERKTPQTTPKGPPPQGEVLRKFLIDLEAELPTAEDKLAKIDLAQLEERFSTLYELGKQLRNNPLLGSLQPRTERLSEFSGPRSSQEVRNLRRDDVGRPHLPAENTVYLGRSLLTDYLLPVELAGTLLLVAAVGAIAISSRKLEGKKPTPVPGPAPRRIA